MKISWKRQRRMNQEIVFGACDQEYIREKDRRAQRYLKRLKEIHERRKEA